MFIRKRLNCSLFFFLLNCVHRKRLNFFPSDVYQKEVELFYTVESIRKRMNCFAKWGSSEGGWIVLPRHLDQQEAEMSCQVICHQKEADLYLSERGWIALLSKVHQKEAGHMEEIQPLLMNITWKKIKNSASVWWHMTWQDFAASCWSRRLGKTIQPFSDEAHLAKQFILFLMNITV